MYNYEQELIAFLNAEAARREIQEEEEAMAALKDWIDEYAAAAIEEQLFAI